MTPGFPFKYPDFSNSIFSTHARFSGLAGQNPVYRFSTVASVLATPLRSLLLIFMSKSNADNPKEVCWAKVDLASYKDERPDVGT